MPLRPRAGRYSVFSSSYCRATCSCTAGKIASSATKLKCGLVLALLGSSPELVRETLDRFGISPLVYSFIDGVEKVSWIPQDENEGIRYYLSQRPGDPRFRPVETRNELFAGDMFYFTCIGEQEELRPVYEIVSADSRYRCTMQQELYRTEYWCEIMPARASKANAVRKLKEMWGCGRVISFGDAVNDLPMFRVSDECYAVSNAAEELKAAATGIIASNEEDGVARWLAEHVVL